MNFALRVLCLPLVAICYAIKWLAILTMKCGCYILSPALWFLGMCCVITIIRQQWEQTILLLIIGVISGLLFAGAVIVAVIAQGIAITLQEI